MAERPRYARLVPELWGGAPARLSAQAEAVLAKADAEQDRFPAWPVTAVPRALGAAFGLPPAAAQGLVLASLCFYAAADAVDDAADGDLGLNPAWKPDWTPHEAVNAGHALLFTSAELLASLPGAAADARARLAADWARAGRRLAMGQAGDLALGAATEAEALAIAAAKTGASLGAFAAWPALAAGLPEAGAEPWRAWGAALGTWIQLYSDVAAYAPGRGPHPDLRELKRTLPLVVALDWAPELAGWLAGHAAPLSEARQAELAARVAATGATTYAGLRVQSLGAAAEAALDAALAAGAAPEPEPLRALMAALPRDPLSGAAPGV